MNSPSTISKVKFLIPRGFDVLDPEDELTKNDFYAYNTNVLEIRKSTWEGNVRYILGDFVYIGLRKKQTKKVYVHGM